MLARHRHARRGAALLTASLATLVFIQYALGVDLQVDRWVHAGWLPDSNPFPGRMAPQTALCFVLAASALWLLESRRRWSMFAAQVLILLVGIAGFLSVIGYSLFFVELPCAEAAATVIETSRVEVTAVS